MAKVNREKEKKIKHIRSECSNKDSTHLFIFNRTVVELLKKKISKNQQRHGKKKKNYEKEKGM